MPLRHKARWRAAAVGLVGAVMVSGCDWSTMAFVQDHRVQIITPADRSTVALPVTIRWQVDGFRITGRNGDASPDAGYFAIFVDRPPMPPGKTLEWMAQQEDSCGDSACGSVKNLADVYSTKKTAHKLTRLPATGEGKAVERHEAVIVLLDGQGQRISESAFYVRFNFERTV